MAGRTHIKWSRVYVDGYDLSGYITGYGPLTEEVEVSEQACLSEGIKGGLPGQVTVGIGTLNGVFDTTATSGLHTVMATRASRNVMIAIGDKAAPAIGVPAFCGQFQQKDYITDFGSVMLNVTIPFEKTKSDAATLLYFKPWAYLLHTNVAATAANTSVLAADVVNNGVQTSAGGVLYYQVTAGDGTCTISVDDSSDGITYGALSGATSGIITNTSPTSGAVAIGVTATVKQYIRWQVAINTGTTVTFASAFVRG